MACGIRRSSLLHQVFGHIEADTTGADHRHLLAHRLVITQDIEVAHHLGMLDTRDIGSARADAGGEDHLVKTAAQQALGTLALAQIELDAALLQPFGEVAQGLVKLLLARDLLGKVELAADFARLIEQAYLMAPLGGIAGKRQPRRTRPHHRQLLGLGHPAKRQLGLETGAGIDQAGGTLLLEHVVEAGLVAGDAGVDLVRPVFSRLDDELGVRQEGARHGDHVRLPPRQDALRHLGGVDAVGGDEGHLEVLFQLGGHPAEGTARHAGGDGGNARLVPADTGVDEGDPHLLQCPAKCDHFLKGGALLHQIQHGEAEDDDEIRAHPLTDGADNLHREAHAVFAAAAPAIGALVGTFADELVDEIAFRPHHLDPVITGRLGQRRSGGEVANGAADLPLAHGPRLERGDGSLEGARRQAERMVGVAARMKDLQRYLAPFPVHCLGHLAVFGYLPGKAQLGAVGHQPPPQIGGDTAGHDETDPATGPLTIEGGQLVKAPLFLLEAGVHGPHQYAVAQLGKTQIEGGQQRGITAHDALLVEVDVHGVMLQPSWLPRVTGSKKKGVGGDGAGSSGLSVNFLLSSWS